MSTKLFVCSLAAGLTFINLAGLSYGLAAEFTGEVVSVLDGDTLEVLHTERIRLNGIEKRQAFGKRAKHGASDLAWGKDVTLQIHAKDKYGCTLADVLSLERTSPRAGGLRGP